MFLFTNSSMKEIFSKTEKSEMNFIMLSCGRGEEKVYTLWRVENFPRKGITIHVWRW